MSSPATKLHSVEIDNEAILSQVSLFAEIRGNTEAFSVLSKLMNVRQFAKGETIIREGEQGSEFFILADGSAAVFKKTQDGEPYKVAILSGHMGAFFGEGALLEADTRNATIVAESDCRCMVLSKTDFDNFSKHNPQWALPILKCVTITIMNRLKKMNQDLALLYKALVDEFAEQR